jgi:hypothetical protein
MSQVQGKLVVEFRGSASNLVYGAGPVIDRLEAKLPKPPGK